MIGAALLLLIASFLNFYTFKGCSSDECGASAWKSELFPLLPSVHLLGLIAAGLFVASRFQPEGRKLLGIGLAHWGAVLSVAAAWDALWSLFHGSEAFELAAGAYLSFVAAAALAAAMLLTLQGLPVLKAPLLPAPRPQQPQQAQPYGGQQGQPYPGVQQGGYGYPGQQTGGHGTPADQSFGGGQYGYPQGQQQPQQPQAQQPQAPQQPSAEFAAFWFAVPVARPLYAEDGSAQQIAELTPGTWYLAVEQRGGALVAQTQDGRRGVLQDVSGLQRG
ncbi:hypothetical protein SAMN05216252_101234 [Actinacidiphila glaucinigra]|uniref:Uncharacterized protein n=1 Tax=Actinacidiphila glaucinigra TaxID=235986 RepID=A0A238ZGA1_9ACTN|nr:hypothetical protein SAMN05216252_101234 [Actinacidiphila glaucinigra]